jgi:hypothetical protein
MLRMAKKRPHDDDSKPPRTADRHLERHTISLSAAEYEALRELAGRNHRPLLWQLRLILHEALTKEGLWPPPPADPS